ncbi:ABC transporter ATP-binding protein [Chelatococcus reniformis]|uniref:ABC transporter ATP-binding protein n=1 Tax=Chelatococcus reniformis TaxID=1494448 RepID=A0A916TWY1_9HYPH|nr:oligopeptide/dipeptide ABC transporter ATP-binding protein [Chelatococcus reniformis]GGC48431.1 ABC transporter ATP-binding protein [Chelatococcus reniformis]
MSDALNIAPPNTIDDAAGPSTAPLIELSAVSRTYTVRKAELRAVDRVSLAIKPGKVLGVVGESGCGKTTLSRMMLRLETPSSGVIRFRGTDIWDLKKEGLRDFHKSVSAVFQDPYSSLNPRHRVEQVVMEPVRVNFGRKATNAGRIGELLHSVGLPATAGRMYPHEFSGGQRQRIAIARAISTNPELILLDEPVSALDVSIRAQILNLLKDLQAASGAAFVFVAHDLGAVRYMSDEVIVMYLGAIVERAPSEALYVRPRHPYTKGLLEASLPPDPRSPNLNSSIEGDLPSPINPPSGCRFRTRCPLAAERCAREEPELREIDFDHRVACHYAG